MIIIVPLAGELKFYPFNETFRIGLGPPVMFFFLLFLQKTPSLMSGFLTALSVFLFRVSVDMMTLHNESTLISLQHHFPAFVFYCVYTCLFQLIDVKRFRERSVLIGLIALGIDFISNGTELLIDCLFFGMVLSIDDVVDIVLIALGRSFIVISFFNMLKLYETQSREKHIIEQNEHMLLLVSDLYEETVYLKKTLDDAEKATKDSYHLYRHLKKNEDETSQQALKIAGQIHEIKKDNQRILAGLSTLITNESPKDFMNAQDLIQLTLRINEKYAASLRKKIAFSYSLKGNHLPYHVYTFLSLVNNLVSNAVEAMKEDGCIQIQLIAQHEMVELHVFNSGLPISEKYSDVIFEPGFTTKYDEKGNPSTGIGLAHVKELVKSFKGDIMFVNKQTGVLFTIKIPVYQLIQKG